MIYSLSVQRFLYLGLLVGIGGAAVVRIAVTSLAFLRLDMLGTIFSTCPVPVICIFDDPVMPIIDLLMPSHRFGPGGEGPNVSYQYLVWNGPLVVALLIVVLATRRLLAFRAVRSLGAPQSFSGFPFGLVILGIALIVYGYFDGSVATPFRTADPRSEGVICLFVAFVVTELSSLGRTKAPRAGDAQAFAKASDIGAIDAPAEMTPRRWPIWGVISLVLPLFGVLGFFLSVATLSRGGGFAALAAASFGVFPVAIGFGFGAIATIVAVLRKERWVALQVVAFAANFGIGLPLIVHLVRP